MIMVTTTMIMTMMKMMMIIIIIIIIIIICLHFRRTLHWPPSYQHSDSLSTQAATHSAHTATGPTCSLTTTNSTARSDICVSQTEESIRMRTARPLRKRITDSEARMLSRDFRLLLPYC
jgi:hypothetical protein